MDKTKLLEALADITAAIPSMEQRAKTKASVTTLLEALGLPIEHASNLTGYGVRAFYARGATGDEPRLHHRTSFIELEWLSDEIDDSIITTTELAADVLGMTRADVQARLSIYRGSYVSKAPIPYGPIPGRFGQQSLRYRLTRLERQPAPDQREAVFAKAVAHRNAALARRAKLKASA